MPITTVIYSVSNNIKIIVSIVGVNLSTAIFNLKKNMQKLLLL